MRVALVHDWLFHMRGGEKVLEALAEIYPDAPIYTLFYNKKKLSPIFQKRTIKSSWLQWLPGIRIYYRWLLPILPFIIRTLKIDPVDLVISTSHCVAKGVKIPHSAKHLCYCHTPIRYVWGFENEYFRSFPFPLKQIVKQILEGIKRWDLESNRGVHLFVSNSENVRSRIRDYYNRDSTVVYPPLDAEFYYPIDGKKDFYFIVSAFVPYKRVDIVIEAFNELDKKLIVVGSGPLQKHYRSLRKRDNISFLGSVSGQELRQLYSQAKAVLFPTYEDFGIVPLEAQACGTPVIAYGKGGALESVKTGLFFSEQNSNSVREAVAEFERSSLDLSLTREKVLSFSKSNFKSKIQVCINQLMQEIDGNATSEK